jgi:Fe-S-cluster containining protein
MSRNEPRRRLGETLAAAAAAYQEAVVIPHCPRCSRPCCRLDPLVLELEWTQLKTLWQIEEARATFDRRLETGQGPSEIRAADGLYFAHGKACPAYDEGKHNCRVYGQDVKPVGCSDFPVYEDDGSVTADLRCEAVALDGLAAALGRAVGPEFRVRSSADVAFPFLVTLSLKRVAGAAGKPKRPPRKPR